MKSLISTAFILIITLFSGSVFSAKIAGKIIMAKGEVQAINESGVIRSLKRRDSIFSHEIIKTGSASRVQIRFIDNALLALKENSELNIKAYVYNEANENENQVLMELLTGGFRTLTGKIGKGNKEAYKVNTPVASIGIRGTLYDVQISMDKIYAGVWKGGIALKTEQGDFNLGMNANFDFAEISSSGDFTGLLTPPASLTPTSSSRQETKSKSTRENTTKNNSQNKTTQASATLNNDAVDVPSPLERRKPPRQEDVQKDDDFVASDDSNTDNNTIPDTPVVTPLPAEGYTPDIRLTPAEFTQLSDGPKVAFILGLAKQNIGVGLNTNGDGERFFLSPTVAADGTSNYDIIRRGNALEKDFSNTIPWSDQVRWGIWQGTEETPIQKFTRFNNDQFSEPLAKDLFYMEFNPATALEIQNGLIDGNFVYSTSSTSLAGTNQTDYIANASNNGSITNVNAQFNLTASSQIYTLSNINLNIDVDLNNDNTADQAWNVSAQNGQLDGAKITVDTLQGFLTNFQSEQQSEAKGTLTGFLLSPKSGTTVIDTFAGGFELSTVDGVEHIGGVLILQAGQRSQAQ